MPKRSPTPSESRDAQPVQVNPPHEEPNRETAVLTKKCAAKFPGQPLALISYGRELNEHLAGVEAVQQSDQGFGRVLDALQDGFLILDPTLP